MLEVIRRTFVEGKGVIAEAQDWKSRELPLDARGWSSYCVFLTDRERGRLEDEIRKALPRATLQVVPSSNPAALWVKGARWELCQAIDALKL